jgi:hypothetical protein
VRIQIDVIRNALFGLAASEDVTRDITRGAVVRVCECASVREMTITDCV